MPTSVKENYLKALYFLQQENEAISVTELSRRLGVSKPTASNMVKSLQERGYVRHQRYKPVRLTDAGRRAAALVIRKHRLTEMFLHKVMGFGWEEVHEIAEQIEHINSVKFFARMDEMLGSPGLDPHGSPIPDRDGNIPERSLQSLSTVAPGREVRLSALGHSSADLLHYLNSHRIELGARLKMLATEPFDGSCQIRCNDREPITISREVAERLLVE